MKKYLLMARNIVFYAGLYLAVQAVAGMFYGIFYLILHISDGINQAAMQASLMKNVYFITFLSAVVTLIIYILCLRKKEENIWKRCNFKKITFGNSLFSIIIAICYSAVSIALVEYLGKYITSYAEVNETISGASESMISTLCVVLFLPIFEEILFRGLIFYELKRSTHIIAAVIVQAILFGVFHMNLLQGIYTAIFALILISLYLIADSIWASIIAHIVYNVSGTAIMPRLFQYTSNYLILYLVIGAILTTILLFIMKNCNNKVRVNI